MAVIVEPAMAIQGWMSNRELIWLAETARMSEVIIEVGCYLGRTTLALADNTPGIVYAIDPWDKFYPDNDGNKHCIEPDVYEKFVDNLSDHIKNGKVIVRKERFTFFPIENVDFIFLDGDHREEIVEHDIWVAEKMIYPGGLIAGHDYTHDHWPGVKLAVDKHYGNQAVEMVDSIWAAKYRS